MPAFVASFTKPPRSECRLACPSLRAAGKLRSYEDAWGIHASPKKPEIKKEEPNPATCSAIGDCGRAYQACCAGFEAKGFPCGCHLQDGTGSAGSNCGDCGTGFTACCLGFKAKGYPCKCDVQ